MFERIVRLIGDHSLTLYIIISFTSILNKPTSFALPLLPLQEHYGVATSPTEEGNHVHIKSFPPQQYRIIDKI